MFEKEKYYGEIWLPENVEQKYFCILIFKNGKVILETNLGSNMLLLKEEKILGVFTGLGHLTFIDCTVSSRSSGMISSFIYDPRYTFQHAKHHYNANFKSNCFNVVNNGLLPWRRFGFDLDEISDKLKIDREEIHEYRIDNKKLSISLIFYTNYNFTQDKFTLSNQSRIKFAYDTPQSIVQVMEDYQTFQKTLQFITGNTKHFLAIHYLCNKCNVSGQLYFEDQKYENFHTSYFTIEYEDIYPYLFAILYTIYTDKRFNFCVDKLLDNHRGKQISHSKRFTNSITSFEGYCKIYMNRKNAKLNWFLIENKELICSITKMSDHKFDNFVIKLVRSRNYYVHSNIDDSNFENIFSEFELLYISFIMDIIVAINLLRQVSIPQSILDKIIFRGISIYHQMQIINKELSNDSLLDPKI
jgi:hypothetical protein